MFGKWVAQNVILSLEGIFEVAVQKGHYEVPCSGVTLGKTHYESSSAKLGPSPPARDVRMHVSLDASTFLEVKVQTQIGRYSH